MAKAQSTFVNMVATLFLVSLLSSASVGYVYEITKGPKAAADLAKKIKAIKTVTPDFDNNPLEEKREVMVDGGQLTFYPIKKEGKTIATAMETFTNEGFGGTVRVMVGFLPDGTIYDLAVLDHKETPGLGDKMDPKKSLFSRQFKGKNPSQFKLSVKKDGGDVDGITAATISSRAFCDAVSRAYAYYLKEGKE